MDNALMESCWGARKNELINHSRFLTRSDVKREITECIEIFFNKFVSRLALVIGLPAAFMQKYYEMQVAA